MDADQGAPSATGGLPRAYLSRKAEEKYRKRDPKSWENVAKALAGMDDTEKINHLEKMYQDLYQDLRQSSQQYQQLLKQIATKQKEIDHSQSELAKSVVARSRLENLCRELQKQNKQIKEENMAKIKEEEERRKEVSSKFADKLTDINNMMDENKEKSEKLREENLKMTAKLAELYNQFQKREEDITKMSKQLELERQYSQASLSKLELEIQAEKEINAREQTILKSNLEKSEANCSVLLETVKGLQDHIDVYKNQYEDFETTMSKSTRVFDNFKAEIANMTKQVAVLEQEALSWKNKFHDSMKALVEMSELKKNQEMYLNSVDRKNDQLHKLCRQLQIERSHYLKMLKEHGIEPASVASPSKEKTGDEHTVSKKTVSPKLTKKEKELQLLKENLKAVQDELSRISVVEIERSNNKTDEPTSQVLKEDSAKNTNGQLEEQVLQLTELINEQPKEPIFPETKDPTQTVETNGQPEKQDLGSPSTSSSKENVEESASAIVQEDNYDPKTN